MSDYAIPEAEAGYGEDKQAQATSPLAPQTASPAPSGTHAVSSPQATHEGPGGAAAADDSAACQRTLLETAVTCRSVEEVAELVTLLNQSGQVTDAANHALRAAAVSRPVEDVISLAVLLGAKDSKDEPERRPSSEHRPEPTARPGRRYPRESDNRRPRPDALESAPGRGLRWPVAVALAVSALMYLPRHPGRLLASGGLPAWPLLGLAGVCSALGVLVLVRDRTAVWTATTVAGVGLVSLQALATVLHWDLWAGALGSHLPWHTGACTFAAGLAAVLSVMVLLYRSDRPQGTPVPRAPALPEAVAPSPDTPPDLMTSPDPEARTPVS
ncbi:hypothetical protein [Streptomyces sp. NPDC054865]